MAVQHVAQQLLHLCDIIPDSVRRIPDFDFTFKRAPGKWSKKEILGHLVDSASNNHQRFVRGRVENVPTIAYDGDAWVSVQQYQEQDRELILQLWETYNRHIAAIVKVISDDDLLKCCKYGDGTVLPLQFLIEDYLHHMEHHLKQIVGAY
ncbi:DinB family protein [Chitinophaga sp. 22321]|uniref:DinB family protein n=1 Tax=Chitinophaga hostae TaxID=2831022 RepID=A0ABS5J7Z4_9BACT|nr:DinB family protein [Chitinophaga hostae]MBS0031336.1 DinB family protein [Chitinophaga hostae]